MVRYQTCFKVSRLDENIKSKTMWIKINGIPLQALEIKDVWIKTGHDLIVENILDASYLYEKYGQHFQDLYFIVVYSYPMQTSINNFVNKKVISEPFNNRWYADEVRDDLLKQLNKIEAQLLSVNINPRKQES